MKKIFSLMLLCAAVIFTGCSKDDDEPAEVVIYAVGDLYPNATNPVGVVFSVTDEGAHGKVLSLTQSDKISWGADGITGAIDKEDGRVNVAKIKALDSDLSDYPAFKWCADLGAGWYLPAKDEISAFYSVVTILNTTLGNTANAVAVDGYYVSSTASVLSNGEEVATNYVGVNPTGSGNGGRSQVAFPARAVLAF